jgi:hypothetical protein
VITAETMDHTQTLPDDMLASILRRLLPRGLAASRCVCKAWLAVVDTHGMLLPHVLPHSVCGLFFNYVDYHRLHFFARPSPRLPINGNLNFLPHYHYHFNTILDHCNSLLLCNDAWSTRCVVNPATRQWDNLPWEYKNANPHLVFDPTISPHYEVFSIPRVPNKIVPNTPPQVPQRLTEFGNLKQSSWSHVVEDGSTESTLKEHKQNSDILSCFEPPLIDTIGEHEDPIEDLMEWPPYLWGLNVFSSNTRKWHTRLFLRESGVAGTMADARPDLFEPRPSCWGKYGGPRRRYSAYWKGSLYVHCHGAFVVKYKHRSTSLQNLFQIIPLVVFPLYVNVFTSIASLEHWRS